MIAIANSAQATQLLQIGDDADKPAALAAIAAPTTTGTASWPYPPPTAARKPTSRTRAVKRRARFGVGGQQRRRPLATSS